ncbi:MAG: hypothetical protein K2X93_27240 [Candidatus Obscuribacterales bacterium]|nr:hypothetical protein [Candidatus Obscuribacterales bacterium]
MAIYLSPAMLIGRYTQAFSMKNQTDSYKMSISVGNENYQLRKPNDVFRGLVHNISFLEPLARLATMILTTCRESESCWLYSEEFQDGIEYGGALTSEDVRFIEENRELVIELVKDVQLEASRISMRGPATAYTILTEWIESDSNVGGPRFHLALLLASTLGQYLSRDENIPIKTLEPLLKRFNEVLTKIPLESLSLDGGKEAKPEDSIFDSYVPTGEIENDSTSPYMGEHGKSLLRTSFCGMLDILGFVERTREAIANNQQESLFSSLSTALSRATLHIKQAPVPLSWVEDTKSFWSYKFFTDNVVIGYPTSLDTSFGESELGRLIEMVGTFQLAMVLAGFPVRGSISYGQLHLGDDVVFGDALITAHDLESKVARDPRVILSPESVILLQKHLSFYGDDFSAPQNRMLLKDADGQIFVNYLYLALDLNRRRAYWADIEAHKAQIENGLVEYRNSPRIWSKYFWLANYHNFFCTAFVEQYHSELIDNLLIDSSLAVSQPERIITHNRKSPDE